MLMTSSTSRSIIINPQWQGSRRGQWYPLGAHAIASLLAEEKIVLELRYDHGDRDRQSGRVMDETIVLEQLRGLSDVVYDHMNGTLFHLGSDCGAEIIPIWRLNARHQGRLNVLWFDAHPDLHTVETMPTPALNGMSLASAIGTYPACLAALRPSPVEPGRVCLAGVRIGAASETALIESLKLQSLSVDDLNAGPQRSSRRLFDDGPVYVHVDYDVLDPVSHPNTPFPIPDGIAAQKLVDWLKWVRTEYNVVGMGLTEYSPCSSRANHEDVRLILGEGFGLQLTKGGTSGSHRMA